MNVPYGPGRKLHLYYHSRDDRRSEKEHAAAIKRAEAHGYKPPRRERMPNRSWWLHASLYRDEAHAPAEVQADRKQLAHWREQDIGTLFKGWWRVGWTRYRLTSTGLELALGGEDNMLQCAFRTPLLSAALGVKVPRTWTDRWIYERRVWAFELGYLGSIMRLRIAHDDGMDNMGDYYRRRLDRVAAGEPDDRPVIRGRRWPSKASMWAGWEVYVGGTHVWEKQVTSRIFGKREYTAAKEEAVPVTFSMPDGEGPFQGTVTCMVETWKRPRAPWKRERIATDIEVTDPPMFAGKGENSWDCDDDCFYSIHSRTARTTEQAIDQYVKSVVEQRERYGNPRPKATA